jgi:hypothetical protein
VLEGGWVVQDSETKAVNLCNSLCACVRSYIVVMEENVLHFRTDYSNRCLQFLQFQCNALLSV